MSLMSTGTTALMAFQRALDTAGHNVANLRTEGYSRQIVELATCSSTRQVYGQIGHGVQIANIRRDADALATSRLLDSSGELSRLQQLSALTDRVDALFSDKATNLSAPWSGFFDAASALAADASSNAHRQQLLDSARALGTRFQQMDRQLGQMNDDINTRLRAATDDINRLSRDIADLNAQIGNHADSAAPELLDRRELLIAQLVSYTGGTAIPQDGGQVNVMSAGGHALVVGNHAAIVSTVADPYQPDRLHLAMRSQSGEVRLDDMSFGGQLGGLFEFRRDVLDQSRAELGRLAVGLAEHFNAAHGKGVDLYGEPGGDFFTHASPRVGGHPGNTGSATLSARYGNLGELTGQNVQLHFDGNTWTARNPETGDSVPVSGSGSSDDPLRVGGVELVVAGTPQQGDAFLLQPTSGVAGSISVAITDPSRIAAAAPVKAEAGSGNTGAAKVSAITVTDGGHADLRTPATIRFTSPTTYTIDGGEEITWKEGDVIAANGWQVALTAAPAAGDTFAVGPTGPNSSDNGNANLWGAVESGHLFAGGTVSLKSSVSGLTSRIGSAARDADAALQAQSLLHGQAQEARNAVAGVNLDEEAANILQLQHAYQAAAQLISTADNLFQTILHVTGR